MTMRLLTVCLPQMDCYLVNELGLKASTRRLAVQQMGCMGGFRSALVSLRLLLISPVPFMRGTCSRHVFAGPDSGSDKTRFLLI